jgi:hypothetical protein
MVKMLRKWFLSWSAVSRIDILIAIYLVGLVMVTSWTLFRPAFFRVHDYVHGARIAELTRSAQAGHLPVRWTENFGYGYGMPLFEFYAPLPYYIGGLVYWLTNDLVFASKLLFFIPNLGAVVGSYLLGRELYGRKGGVLVAAAYTLAPYRAVNLFVRGAVSESWGMMAMPFALWAGIAFLRSLSNTSKNVTIKMIWQRSWWVLVASLVVLFLSHNLSTLMYVPVSGVFLLLVTWQTASHNLQKTVFLYLRLLSAYLVAIGLSAFYLIPALIEKDFTIISSILSGYFYFTHHFLYIRQFFNATWGYGGSAWGPEDGISFFLGYGQLLGLAISCSLVAWYFLNFVLKKKSKPLTTQLSLFKQKVMVTHHFQLFGLALCIMVGALFLTLLKSELLWKTLPLISYIQFPWRWLSIAVLFLSLVVGYGAILIKNKRTLMIGVIGLSMLTLHNVQYFRPESFLGRNEDYYYSDPSLIRREMSGVLPDYIPVDLKLAILAKPEEATQGAWLPVNAEGNVVTPATQAQSKLLTVAVNRPHQKLVDVELQTDTPLEFAVAAYPGWKAEIDGKPANTTQSSTGLVTVPTPAGKHSVGIYFGSTPVRSLSDALSLLTLVGVLYSSISTRRD